MKKIENKISEFKKKRNILYFTLLLVLVGVSIILNYAHFTQVAFENTRILNKFISVGNHREVAYILKEAQTSNFRSIRYVSQDKNRSFILPSRFDVVDYPQFIKSLYLDKVEVPVETGIATQSNESIIYEYNRFWLAPYAIVIWLFILLASIPQVRYLQAQMIEKYKVDLENEKKSAKAQIAHLVRHNLRTPLSALMKLSDEPKFQVFKLESDILKSTIYQINEIINQLDDNKTVSKSPNESIEIYQSLFQAKNQVALTLSKEVSFTFRIDDSLFSAQVRHIPFELQSILSNIINNSTEAITGQGFIHVKAADKDCNLVITITDSGKGIPEDNLPKVFEQSVTFGKPNGSGLGLYHAKTFVEQWGGNIQIESEVGHGTIVKITLPIEDRKSWYVPRFKITAQTKIFILDDQGLTHDLWRMRFKELGVENTVFNAKNFLDIKKLINEHRSDLDSAIFLFDFDIQEKINGLHILQTLPTTAIRCLVTGHYDDVTIQKDCEKYEIKLIPKSKISHIPFVVV